MIWTKGGLVGLGLVLALSSCTSSHPAPAGVGPSTTTTSGTSTLGAGSTTEPTASGTPIVAPSSTSSSVAPSGPARCATAALGARLTGASGAAGSTYYTLLLTNQGAAPCVLQGYPGVSFVTGAAGQQIGAPADRISGPAPSLQVVPGASAGAVLQISVASNFGSDCRAEAAAGLRVFPPNQTAALFVAQAAQTCANPADVTLHVGALHSA